MTQFYKATVEIELPADREEDVDDMIHAAADEGGALPTNCTIWTREVIEIDTPKWATQEPTDHGPATT